MELNHEIDVEGSSSIAMSGDSETSDDEIPYAGVI